MEKYFLQLELAGTEKGTVMQLEPELLWEVEKHQKLSYVILLSKRLSKVQLKIKILPWAMGG